MKLTQEQIDHIVREVESVEYGRIIVEVNVSAKHFDVITEKRTRLSRRWLTSRAQ